MTSFVTSSLPLSVAGNSPSSVGEEVSKHITPTEADTIARLLRHRKLTKGDRAHLEYFQRQGVRSSREQALVAKLARQYHDAPCQSHNLIPVGLAGKDEVFRCKDCGYIPTGSVAQAERGFASASRSLRELEKEARSFDQALVAVATDKARRKRDRQIALQIQRGQLQLTTRPQNPQARAQEEQAFRSTLAEYDDRTARHQRRHSKAGATHA